mmetsp:Transcript_37230/g.57180  ORF Transcript_37230/g.57180 Transcript_37230/m.57180 type:complete len:128 (+) Transcript_37230:96-479(+)
MVWNCLNLSREHTARQALLQVLAGAAGGAAEAAVVVAVDYTIDEDNTAPCQASMKQKKTTHPEESRRITTMMIQIPQEAASPVIIINHHLCRVENPVAGLKTKGRNSLYRDEHVIGGGFHSSEQLCH